MNWKQWTNQRIQQLNLPSDSSPFQAWIADVRHRVNVADYDAVMAVTGARGNGKSTTARKLARALDPSFDIERQVCFSFQEFQATADSLDRGQAIVWDEVIEGGMARAAMTKGNRDMEKFFTISRDRNLISFVCAPHIDIFDSTLRKHYFTDWLLKEKRSQVKIHTQGVGGDYPGKIRPWVDLCYVGTTKDADEDLAVYQAKKDAARRAIMEGQETTSSGGGVPVDPQFEKRLRDAVKRVAREKRTF